MNSSIETSRRNWSVAAVAAPLAVAVVVLAVALLLNAPDQYALIEVFDPADMPFLAHSDAGVMILACPLMVIWGASAYRRCEDAAARRHMTCATALLVAWMVLVLARYMCTNGIAVTMLWYFLAVPVNFVPLLFFLVGARLAFPEGASPAVRGFQASATGISVVLALFLFTNPVHSQVFLVFPVAAGVEDFSLNWGFWLVAGWTVLLYAASFVLLFKAAAVRRCGMYSPLVLLVLLVLVFGALLLLSMSGLFQCSFSLAYSILYACCVEMMFRLGLMDPVFVEAVPDAASLEEPGAPLEDPVMTNEDIGGGE